MVPVLAFFSAWGARTVTPGHLCPTDWYRATLGNFLVSSMVTVISGGCPARQKYVPPSSVAYRSMMLLHSAPYTRSGSRIRFELLLFS